MYFVSFFLQFSFLFFPILLCSSMLSSIVMLIHKNKSEAHWKEHKKVCKKPDNYITVDLSYIFELYADIIIIFPLFSPYFPFLFFIFYF